MKPVFITVYCVNLGDGSYSVQYRRGQWTVDQLMAEEENEGYDPYESLGHLEGPLDVLTFSSEEQMREIMGSKVRYID